MYLCDHCGNLQTNDPEEPYKVCRIAGGEACAGCEKLKTLNARIAEAKATLEGLLHERRQLKSNINEVHKALIGGVPAEVLSKIFEQYVWDYSDYDGLDEDDLLKLQEQGKLISPPSPLTLTAVCRTWRHVALSTPEVWTNLTFSLEVFGKLGKDRDRAYKSKLEMVAEWLARSRTLPFHVGVHASPSGFFDSEVEKHLRPIFDVINAHSSRCRRLTLEFPGELLPHFVASPGQDGQIVGYPQIEKLFMWNNSDREPNSILKTEFNLGKDILNDRRVPIAPKIIEVSQIPIDRFHIDWRNVTNAVVQFPNDFDFFKLLQRAPRLEACRLLKGIYIGGDTFPVLHPKLQHLEILTPVLNEILSKITLPNLKSLYLDLEGNELPTDTILQFLARSGAGGLDGLSGNFTVDAAKLKFEYLDVSQVRFSDHGANLVQICRATPNLKRLRVDFFERDKSLDALYTALSNAPTRVSSDASPFLPQLESLEIVTTQASDVPWGLIPEFLLPFGEGENKSRPMKAITIICINQDGNDPVSIDEDSLSKIQQLIRDGIRLVVTEIRQEEEINLIPM